MLVVVVMAASNIAFLAIYFAEPGLREKMQILSVITLKIETTAILLLSALRASCYKRTNGNTYKLWQNPY